MSPVPTLDPTDLPRPDPQDISHVFHTSGTSGTPKPIPHTHSGSVTVLPRRAPPSYLTGPHSPILPNAGSSSSAAPPSESAAFTTTPLFHGGVSDLLRAWMARSVVYFYPTSDVAITADNVSQAVAACQAPPAPLATAHSSREMSEAQESERARRFKVTAFLSVPYILTVLAEDPNGPGMEMLRSMKMVSTGGAPLDRGVGDGMVKAGVRLVSRLGSSECGCECRLIETL